MAKSTKLKDLCKQLKDAGVESVVEVYSEKLNDDGWYLLVDWAKASNRANSTMGAIMIKKVKEGFFEERLVKMPGGRALAKIYRPIK